jgi:hypothetical protein
MKVQFGLRYVPNYMRNSSVGFLSFVCEWNPNNDRQETVMTSFKSSET